MRIKWYCRNKATLYFIKKSAFHTKSYCNSPKGDPKLEIFLCRVVEEAFNFWFRYIDDVFISW